METQWTVRKPPTARRLRMVRHVLTDDELVQMFNARIEFDSDVDKRLDLLQRWHEAQQQKQETQ